jgi:transcriptional regulator with XRE-family HTH domain
MAPPIKKPKTRRPELAEKRRTAGYSQTTFARAIRASPNAVRSWEQGVAEPSIGFRRPVAEVLGISMAEVDRLIGGRPPPDLNGQALNGAPPGTGLSLFVRAEQSAESAQVVDVLRLPALLQTRDYALAVERTFPGAPSAPIDLDKLVDRRLARQAVLYREPEPLKLAALVPWWVLRRTKGSRLTMVDQMTHLLALAERPNVDIRVIPDDPELIDLAASFTLLTSPGETAPNVASADGPDGAIYVEGQSGVAALAQTYDGLAAGAIDSAEAIRQTREAYR